MDDASSTDRGGGAGPETGPSKEGMSTGAKVLFGCLGVAVLGILGLVVALTVGGFALKRGVESAVGSMEQQQEASEMLEEVQEENPFEPPEDGEIVPKGEPIPRRPPKNVN